MLRRCLSDSLWRFPCPQKLWITGGKTGKNEIFPSQIKTLLALPTNRAVSLHLIKSMSCETMVAWSRLLGAVRRPDCCQADATFFAINWRLVRLAATLAFYGLSGVIGIATTIDKIPALCGASAHRDRDFFGVFNLWTTLCTNC